MKEPTKQALLAKLIKDELREVLRYQEMRIAGLAKQFAPWETFNVLRDVVNAQRQSAERLDSLTNSYVYGQLEKGSE